MSKTLLKQKSEKPATIRFSCPQMLAARLKNLEVLAAQSGVEVDIDGPLSAALQKLIMKAERELMPVAAAESTPQKNVPQVFQPMT